MKSTDRLVLIALPAVALVAAFWLLVLSPKREEASSLQTEITGLESEVAEQQQLAEFAEQAREGFPSDYQKVVTLGKAVPDDDDTASLLAQLTGISSHAGVGFRSLQLAESATEAGAAPPPAPAEAAPTTEEPVAEAVPATTAPAATEAVAANLPIGATIGPAGLPVMPYTLEFQGDFFNFADFLQGIDDTVSTADGQVTVDGRLMTIDGFNLSRDLEQGFPSLVASVALTTYVTPPTQGLTAGATPSAPAPVSAPPATGEVAPTSVTEPAP